jgi:4-alpha-glucanotransferase
MQGQDGVYVNYPAEEMYAILALESCRNQTIIVGEDLGMVPAEVRPMMEKHGIWRTFVGQYELTDENNPGSVPSHSVAALNTHDMFPFAAFWGEKDIDQRLKLKLLKETQMQAETDQRRRDKRHLISIMEYNHLADEMALDTWDILQAILKYLAASPAKVLLINLEDLWLEIHPQNVPGTNRNQNWSGKARLSLEQLKNSPRIVQLLLEIAKTRRGEPQTR